MRCPKWTGITYRAGGLLSLQEFYAVMKRYYTTGLARVWCVLMSCTNVTVVKLQSSGKGVSMPNRQTESTAAPLGCNDWIAIREAGVVSRILDC